MLWMLLHPSIYVLVIKQLLVNQADGSFLSLWLFLKVLFSVTSGAS